ncbi:MAG: hypothetical protein COA91_07550 [Robiginitomaculum sp.]|nr:MAG: hypothetical protein COA91_07550 [Robiginitomaculum sp.]
MTLVENMSEPERRSWATLIVDVTVFFVFLKSMLRKGGVENLSASELIGLYIWIIVATVILHVIIASVFAARVKNSGYESDERDVEIERKGARIGFWVVGTAINIIIFMFLMENAFPGDYGPIPGLSFLTPSHMFFALMGTMFLGDIAYRATMVHAYRQDAV